MEKVRLLKASSVYPGYIEYLAQKGVSISGAYKKQMRAILDDRFGWSDYWQTSLPKDSFEVEEIIVNLEEVQKTWAREHDFEYGEDWLLPILEAQIAAYKPDVLLITDYGNVTPEFRLNIKKNHPNVKLIIGWDGVAHNDPELYKGYDMVMSCMPWIAEFYSNNGFDGYFFKYGFLGDILNNIDTTKNKYPLTFVGSIFSGKGFHNVRMRVLSAISKKLPLHVWTISFGKYDLFSRDQIKRIVRFKFKEYFDVFAMSRRRHKPVFGLDMFERLAQSGITLNVHIDATGDAAGNLRLFEATGAGACVITDEKSNIGDYFEVGKEIVTYSDEEDAIQKIKELLENPEKRSSIAKAGQDRTLKDHKIEDSIKKAGEYILKKL